MEMIEFACPPDYVWTDKDTCIIIKIHMQILYVNEVVQFENGNDMKKVKVMHNRQFLSAKALGICIWYITGWHQN